jgi:hypothetical protein
MMRRLVSLILALGTVVFGSAAAAGPDGARATLQYRAYVAGAPVGDAEVTVEVANGAYRVNGLATSTSWLSAFAAWRNEFRAHGRLDGSKPQLAEFAYLEENRRSRRDVAVRDGTLSETKDGRRRSDRPSPEGTDVVSALFVAQVCVDDQVLHTGRHVYRLTVVKHTDQGCRLQVTDSDGDRYDIELQLAERGGLLVPERITVHAWLTGWVQLVSSAPQPSTSR